FMSAALKNTTKESAEKSGYKHRNSGFHSQDPLSQGYRSKPAGYKLFDFVGNKTAFRANGKSDRFAKIPGAGGFRIGVRHQRAGFPGDIRQLIFNKGFEAFM